MRWLVRVYVINIRLYTYQFAATLPRSSLAFVAQRAIAGEAYQEDPVDAELIPTLDLRERCSEGIGIVCEEQVEASER